MVHDLKVRSPEKLIHALERYQNGEGAVSRAEAARIAMKNELERKGYWEE